MSVISVQNTIDNEWNQYLLQEHYSSSSSHHELNKESSKESKPMSSTTSSTTSTTPICDDLNISTHTKTLYLNQPIHTSEVFWNIPVIDYGLPAEGVVNKHMKIVMHSEDEVRDLENRLSEIPYYKEHIIRQVNIVHSKRPKYKDERKITIGISKKDIINTRKKQKGAFMNCFAMIVRFLDPASGNYREVHVKVFKTGNLEIPGVLSNEMLDIAKRMVLRILRPHMPSSSPLLEFVDIMVGRHKSVLINSNFRCGYFINRDLAYHVLRNKYGIDASYDPCSYPGVKCKFYFNHDYQDASLAQCGRVSPEDHKLTMSQLDKTRKYTSVTFTLFRTGSCLISGNCDEDVLFYIYDFVCKFLREEYEEIRANTKAFPEEIKAKKPVLRKRVVRMTPDYYAANVLPSL